MYRKESLKKCKYRPDTSKDKADRLNLHADACRVDNLNELTLLMSQLQCNIIGFYFSVVDKNLSCSWLELYSRDGIMQSGQKCVE